MEEKEVTSLKPDYITTMIKTGSSDIATGDADGFYIQMMNAAPQLFDKALDIASQNEKLRADVFAKLSKDVHQSLAAQGSSEKISVDNAAANSETIRQFIQQKMVEDGSISEEEFRVVLRELRYYQDTIVKTNIEGQAARERMLSLEHTAADAAAHGSTIYKDIAILLGGALLGWGGKSFYDHFIKKR